MTNRIKYETRRGGSRTIPAPKETAKETAADDRKAKTPLKPEVKENE